jgi:cytochrome c oxidase subunit 1
MRSIRFEFRLATFWLLGALYLGGAQWLFSMNRPTTPALSAYDSFYVIAHFHYVLTLIAAFLLFAAIYFVLESVAHLPIRRSLAAAHFGATIIGVSLIFLPMQVLRLTVVSGRGGDLASSFKLANNVSSAGYLLTLFGLALFLALLIDALWRRFGPSQPLLGAR